MSAIVASHSVNPETPVHVERPESSLSQKVQKVAFEGLYWVVWGFVALVGTVTAIPVGTAMHYRYNSEKEFSGTIHALAKSRYFAVREAIGNSVNTLLDLQDVTLYDIRNSHGQAICKLKGSNRERGAYAMKVLQVMDLVRSQNAPKDGLHDHMQLVRARLDALIAHPVYQQNKEKADNFWIQFVQDAAHAFVAESEGMGPMEEFGRKALEGESLESPSYSGLANLLRETVSERTRFSADTKLEKLFWSFAHPMKALAACMDATGIEQPVNYNSFQHGNASIQVGTFTINGVNFSLSQSPTFTCDRLTEAACDRGDKRIFQDIETDCGPIGERGRVAAKKAASSPNLDGSSGAILHVHTPIDVHRGEQADQFGLSGNLSGAAEKALGQNEAAKAILYASVKGLKTMVAQSTALHSGETVYVNQSCKQNIDRGLVVNVATILLADVLAGKELTGERVHQIVGMTLVRPGMVDDRAIMDSRLNPLCDLLGAMEQDPALLIAVKSEVGSSVDFHESRIRAGGDIHAGNLRFSKD